MTTASPIAALAHPEAAALPGWPVFEADERAAVERVLRSGRVNYWTGEETRAFEREFAAYVGVPHGIAVANGTVALELALYAFGIGPGDEVIVPARTFIATASAVVMRGAIPIVADIDPASQNLTADTVHQVIGPRTRAIIPVHLAGWPCDMDPIMALADRHGLRVIEDCAQAHGARYRGRPVGSLGHAAAFSFCQDKIMTTGGEGGMVLMADSEVRGRAWSFKDHGKSEAAMAAPSGNGGFRLVHESFGTNWRITEMQAAIGRVQLRKLDGWVAQRRRNAERLMRYLQSSPVLTVPVPEPDILHSYYKLYAFIRPAALAPGWSRDRLLAEINAVGIPCFTGSSPEIYLEKAFRAAGLGPRERLPMARELGEQSLMFQVHPTLEDSHMDRIGTTVLDVLDRAMR